MKGVIVLCAIAVVIVIAELVSRTNKEVRMKVLSIFISLGVGASASSVIAAITLQSMGETTLDLRYIFVGTGLVASYAYYKLKDHF